MQRIEQHAAQAGGRPAERGAQIGAPYVADELGVSGENGVRLRVAGTQVVNNDGDGLWSVAWRFQVLEADAPKFDGRAITKRGERVRGFGCGTEIDRYAYAIAQLQVACDEIGVEMGQENMADPEGVFGSEGKVLVDVPLRIDDRRRPGPLASNDVRSMREQGR